MQLENQLRTHVKVQYHGEFRRFALEDNTFASLSHLITESFQLHCDYTIKFLDDEKDWVLLTSDQDLLYAVDIAGSPLKLLIKTEDDTSTTKQETVTADSCQETETLGEPLEPRWTGKSRGCRGRGGRGGKGARGRGGKWKDIPIEERLQRKTSRLTSRIEELEKQIQEDSSNSDRARVLRWRLIQLQNKLQAVTAKKLSLEESLDGQTSDKPLDDESTPELIERPARGGRRGRGRGRGCHHPARDDTDLFPPTAESQDLHRQFIQCKVNLKVARKTGTPEEFQAAKEALQQLKQQRREARGESEQGREERKIAKQALKEKRLFKKQCMANLREARQSEDAQKISECREALAKATLELQATKHGLN